MDDKLAADEARRSVQHESVKAQVEGEVQAEIVIRRRLRLRASRKGFNRSPGTFGQRRLTK